MDFLNRGIRFYIEKPIAINSFEINQLDRAVEQAKEASYYGDHLLFKALGLYALMGVDMPFKEHLRIEQDDSGALRKAIDSRQSLLGKIKRIEGYILEGEGCQGTIEGREWLGDLK